MIDSTMANTWQEESREDRVSSEPRTMDMARRKQEPPEPRRPGTDLLMRADGILLICGGLLWFAVAASYKPVGLLLMAAGVVLYLYRRYVV